MMSGPVLPYDPAPQIPSSPSSLPAFLKRELVRISNSFRSIKASGAAGSFLPIVSVGATTATAGHYSGSPPAAPLGYIEASVTLTGATTPITVKIPYYSV